MSLARVILGCWILFGCLRCFGADTIVASNPPPAATTSHYTLWQAIDLSLKQNPDVLIARKKLEEAAGGVIEARAGFLPSLSTSDNYEVFQSTFATLNGEHPTERNYIWALSVRLYQTAYAGGAVRGRMSIARLNQQSRLLDYQSTVDRIMLNVRLAFYEILKDKADIGVHQQAADFLQKQLAYQRQRVEIGTGQKLDALQAGVELSLEQSALIESQNLWRNAGINLSELLALPYAVDQTETPLAAEGLLDLPPFDLNQVQCLDTAMSHRPELKVSDNDLAAQKKQLVVDRSAVLPHVNLFLGYDVVSEPDRLLPDDYYRGYVAGVGVTWNIFDGFATYGRMTATRARIDEAKISQSAASRSVQAEVIRAFHDLERARETIQSQRENVDLATQSQSLADANFKEGLITQLDLLQSRLDLTRAQTTELNARFDYNSALAQLQYAMGSELNLSDEPQKK